jgi:predicted DNA-binding protein YlxM (UPF0122 family)
MEQSRVMRSMLLDFYGELLTEKQRQCYDLHFNEDLSLAEIAEECGVSRQGVWDNIRRAESAMAEVEEKTGLLRRFEENRKALEDLRGTLRRLREVCTGEARGSAGDILHIDIVCQRDFALFQVHAKNFFTAFQVRKTHGNLPVKTSRTKECLIQNVRTVCRSD